MARISWFRFQYEGLSAVIYEIPWYHLSIPDQKMLKFFLQKSQMPTKLYLMGEKSMNVETGLSVSDVSFFFSFVKHELRYFTCIEMYTCVLTCGKSLIERLLISDFEDNLFSLHHVRHCILKLRNYPLELVPSFFKTSPTTVDISGVHR